MLITTVRLNDNGDNTLGKCFIEAQQVCWVLEDTYREIKVPELTRIPAGRYDVTLRTEGGMHGRYSRHRDPWIRAHHQGMIWIRNIPDYKYVYFHIGNYASDTEGCPLVGTGHAVHRGERIVTNSTTAYKEFYSRVIGALNKGEEVQALFLDADR